MKITFTTAFNRSSKSIRDCNVKEFTVPSKVKQSLAYATDINEIYEQYCRTGRLPLNGKQPIYDENFVKYDSLIEAQKLVQDATEYFVGLPAKIKNQYSNDLGKFIKALNAKDEFLVKEGVLNLPVKEETHVELDVPVVEKPVETPMNTASDGLS